MEEEMNEDQQRKKRKPTKAQAVEHPEKKDEEMSAPEKKKKEQKPKEKKFRIPRTYRIQTAVRNDSRGSCKSAIES